ncbi:hypothetical protein GCM10010915_14190 [Microbacterium faecale]|uniref:Uncharacterized protein n=1 Tax=Microbacterium faecale TaxID=1804630 RepID=A0A917DFX4_9MICO|nr:hypothetical protein [Microbacterium faecale]GGD34950.1 hypothetical protein GCM10010915_14190 [Microbacterium faecale]
MSAAVLPRPVAVTRIERAALASARLLTAWVAARAARREARRDVLARRIHAEQTATRDPRQLTYELACGGHSIR